LLTVATVWAYKAASEKPAGKYPTKSMEAECEALVRQRRGPVEIEWLFVPHRGFPEISGIAADVERT